MHPERMLARMVELERYVGWTDDDAQRLAAALSLLQPALPSLVDDFYDAIHRTPNVRALLTGGPPQIERLKGLLNGWLVDLISGPFDADYLTRRSRVGLRHVEIGVDAIHTAAAMARLRVGLDHALHERWNGACDDLQSTRRALHKRVDLDLAIITDVYQSEMLDRMQRNERLATLGQIAGGVAHELRNPLNVVKTSVYYLLHARAATPAKVEEHLQRIERQVDLSNNVISALSSFARSPVPQLRPVAIDSLIRESLDLNPPGDPAIQVQITPTSQPLWASCDPDQIAIVFANLLRNASDAMTPGGGTLGISARPSGDEIVVEISDTGTGIPPDDLARILEPLYSTKARGLGLGLAIARSLIDKNEGSLRVQSQIGQGSTFSVFLRAAVPPQ